MPPPGFRNEYTGESVTPDQFANGLGDPNGNTSIDDELRYFQSYLNAHPDWQGNAFIGVRNGKVYDKRGFLDRHSGLIAGLGAAALPASVFAGPVFANAFAGGGSGSAPLASTPISGTAALPSVGGGALASTPIAGTAALPSVAGGIGSVAAPTVAGGAGASGTAGAAGAAGAGGSVLSKLGLGWQDLIPLAASTIGAVAAPPDRPVPNQDAMDELIRLQTQRVKDADPLYQTVLRMAMALAPTGARG